MVTVTFDGPVASITLDDGKGNALNTRMLREMEGAFDRARAARAVILRGREKVFCGGLDLPELIDLPRPALTAFFELFDRVHEGILAFPRPIVACARGSAIAGGAILLCAGDARLVTPAGKVGITESVLGLSFPLSVLEVLRVGMGDQRLAEAAALGKLYEGPERIRIGFATEIVEPERIDGRAAELAQQYASADPDALAQIRAQLRRPAIERYRAHAEADRTAFVDRWYAPAAQAALRGVVARLTGR
jgi:enoyl-CoA hydratase